MTQTDWERRTEPAELPEWMDGDCSYEELRSCLLDLAHVNKLALGYRPTLNFLERLIATRKNVAKLRILDVGFGGGDALYRIGSWAQARGVSVDLTGIDLNPLAAHVAKEQYGNTNIEWMCGNAFEYQGEVDVVISSLLTHHLATNDVIRFIRWMEQTATFGWFINDLERSARSASLFSILAYVIHWHAFVKHDGPVSFARSFVREDWCHMLSEAGVPIGAAKVKQSFPARLCVTRFR